MTDGRIAAAAATLWNHFQRRTKLETLPDDRRPANRAEGYAVQSEVVRLSGQTVVGSKIAATARQGKSTSAWTARSPLRSSRVV